MKTTYKLLLVSVIALWSANCETINNAIDDLLTFNVTRSVETPLPASTPTGILIASPGIPVPLDSTTLATNKTSFSKLKTAKLSLLTITFSDPTYTLANFDSLYINIKADSLPEINLATYGTSKGMTYSQLDFASYIKSKNAVFLIGFKCNTAPKSDINMNSAFTFAFTAQPL